MGPVITQIILPYGVHSMDKDSTGNNFRSKANIHLKTANYCTWPENLKKKAI